MHPTLYSLPRAGFFTPTRKAIMGFNEVNQMARMAFNMPPAKPNSPPPTKKDLAGLFKLQTSVNDVILDCYIEYEPGFSGSYDEPPYSEKVSLQYALADGVPVQGLLCEADVDTIEDEARMAINESKADEAEDIASERYADREAA